MLKLWLRLSPIVLGLFLVPACLSHPESEFKKNDPTLVVKGRSETSTGLPAGKTAIYIEQSAAPELLSADDGSFELSFDAARLEKLRLQYGLQKSMLRLYFVNEANTLESAVIPRLNIESRGVTDLGSIQLQQEIPVNGRVLSMIKNDGSQLPVVDAKVLLGRRELRTDAEGKFTGTAPQFYNTPLVIEKKGFVQTLGEWLPTSIERDFPLVNELLPFGNIEAIPGLRSAANTMILFNYSATSTAHWIRFGSSPELLNKAYEANAPWLSLNGELSYTLTDAVIYYQFADAEKKILSPVFSYTMPTAL